MPVTNAERTVILPVRHRRMRHFSIVKGLLFMALLFFFFFCVRLIVLTTFDGTDEVSSAVATFLIEKGMGLPK